MQAELAELNALNREIRILQEAETAGLGRGRDLARLVIQRDGLRQSVAAGGGRGRSSRPTCQRSSSARTTLSSVVARSQCGIVNSMRVTQRLLTEQVDPRGHLQNGTRSSGWHSQYDVSERIHRMAGGLTLMNGSETDAQGARARRATLWVHAHPMLAAAALNARCVGVQ